MTVYRSTTKIRSWLAPMPRSRLPASPRAERGGHADDPLTAGLHAQEALVQALHQLPSPLCIGNWILFVRPPAAVDHHAGGGADRVHVGVSGGPDGQLRTVALGDVVDHDLLEWFLAQRELEVGWLVRMPRSPG